MAKRKELDKNEIDNTPVAKREDYKKEVTPVKEDIPVKAMVVNCGRVNLREGPDKNSKIIMELVFGTVLTKMSEHNIYAFVAGIINGKKYSGYVHGHYIKEV